MLKCGCFWRLNPPSEVQPDGSWSLYDAEQKSCEVCDNSPDFLSVIEHVESASDTPKTDNLATRRAYAIGRGDLAVCWHEMADHARQLERESEAFRQQLNKLEKSVMEFEVTVKSIKPNCRPPQSQEWNRGFAAAQRALIYAYEICFKEQPCRDQ